MKLLIAAALAATSFSASALTFESGQVFSNGQVVDVEDTAIGRRQLEENGYVVVGNNVVINVEGVGTATVTVQDAIAGGTVLREAVIDSVRGEIQDLSELDGLTYEEIDVALRNNDIGANISVEEIQELIDETQLNEIAERSGDAVANALRDLDEGRITGATVIGTDGSTHLIGDHAN